MYFSLSDFGDFKWKFSNMEWLLKINDTMFNYKMPAFCLKYRTWRCVNSINSSEKWCKGRPLQVRETKCTAGEQHSADSAAVRLFFLNARIHTSGRKVLCFNDL